MANITGDEIRARLVTLTSTDISDTQLATAGLIPAGDAWLYAQVGTLASLTANNQALAKAAEIAWVCAKVVGSAPYRTSQAGPIRIQDADSQNKKAVYDMLMAEVDEFLDLLGVSSGSFHSGTCGGNDYEPDSYYTEVLPLA